MLYIIYYILYYILCIYYILYCMYIYIYVYCILCIYIYYIYIYIFIYLYICAIMKTMCPPGHRHNGFVATHALREMMQPYLMCPSEWVATKSLWHMHFHQMQHPSGDIYNILWFFMAFYERITLFQISKQLVKEKICHNTWQW